jgi:lipopolysaccharide export LptBFGC system permease protein LptF
MKDYLLWFLIACVFGFLFYLGRNQFHQKNYILFLIIFFPLIFGLVFAFFLLRGKEHGAND